MFGLGKKRSKFGKWLDQKGITQSEVAKKAKVSNDTISRLCNESDYTPKISTVSKIKKALDKLGADTPPDDYFGM
ncbi:helix-turn-helix transcriptional regulator [Metabacillus litoralis]|uniref:helix-turn-helix transcriptional regulator n=1 Tax=Metabacillus litoralis TaxID=152268 RepID=UPI00203DFEC9|nr:helix-turn-helix transcriptional regulator [Metabacillus litoralis]MCM3160974.1 helix-turn-helix transcriptional regulator [Metabacillus litoralis]